MMSVSDVAGRVESVAVLSRFRVELYGCLTARSDALFELTDAVLCAEGPVKALVELSLPAEHRRGHGALYGGLERGGVEVTRLRWALAALPLPRAAGGRIVLAVDVSPWLRPAAPTSDQRMYCHVHGQAQCVAGWPYSVVAALETGRTSWTAVLDAVRLGHDDDATQVTVLQLRQAVERLIAAGHWRQGDPDIWIVADAGYDLPRLAFELADLPVQVTGRIRADRVLRLPAPPPTPRTIGRPRRHGARFELADPATWPTSDHTITTATAHYGTATATSWDRLHPHLLHRGAWHDHPGPPPIIEGTLIRLQVQHLPGNRTPTPIWLWSSITGADPACIDRLWQAYLRRFDLEHTFRFFKQTLGWTRPKIRSPQAADRWTWLIIAAHTQLRLARRLATDLRRPWEKPAPPDRLTPARVRRGFRNLRATLTSPARAPKPTTPGPGRPPGSTNRHPAPHHHVGKTTKHPKTPGRLNEPTEGKG